jgi:hypothetical protein
MPASPTDIPWWYHQLEQAMSFAMGKTRLFGTFPFAPLAGVTVLVPSNTL